MCGEMHDENISFYLTAISPIDRHSRDLSFVQLCSPKWIGFRNASFPLAWVSNPIGLAHEAKCEFGCLCKI